MTIPTWQAMQAEHDPEGSFAQRKWMQDEIDALREESNKLRAALGVLLDQVDYTAGACGLTDMVGACLDAKVIDLARKALHG